MKTKEQKQKDLNALAEQLNSAKSAMIVSFNKLTVNKDQEFRHQLREAGANYKVVKNTIARLAVKGTPYEEASEHFTGVTAIAWTENDPVVLSKTISKFIKDNSDFYSFKAGVVDGKVVGLSQIEKIASLPSKEELIAQLLYLLKSPAQRLATVLNVIPRNLAVVLKQVSEKQGDVQAEHKSEPEEKSEEVKEEAPDTAQENESVSEESDEQVTGQEEALVTETEPEEKSE